MKNAKKIIIWIAKKNVFARELMRKTKKAFQVRKYKKIIDGHETDEKLCIFEAFNGRKYCDSPKALYLQMLREEKYKDFKFVWCFIDPQEFEFLRSNGRTEVVKYDSLEYMETYSKAKYWFTCSRLPDYLIPKKDQIFIQCWHGTPLKRIGADIELEGANALNTKSEIIEKYEYDAARYTYMVSPSKFTSEKYISAFHLKKFNKENCIIEKGYPRNDELFKYDEDAVKEIKKKLDVPEGKKVILYAPTWRDNQHKAGVGYVYKLGIDFDAFKNNFSDDYVILFRTHYFVVNTIDLAKYQGFIIDVSKYSDINDLYIISDLIITDYSSVFFDYANLKRPILFYMYDLEEYKNNLRDFYFDIQTLPGPVVETEEQLYKELKNIGGYWERYAAAYEAFIKKYNYLDDASSSKRVLDDIIQL